MVNEKQVAFALQMKERKKLRFQSRFQTLQCRLNTFLGSC